MGSVNGDTGYYASKKRVLIVGANSYIGDSFARYAQDKLAVDVVDSYEEWKKADFKLYDSILMVAGLAHKPWSRRQRKANSDLYFAVNRDLALAVAEKAKASGVGQFIYLSSMAVYGMDEGEITRDTKPAPKDDDYYGLSKLQAEERLMALLEPRGIETDTYKRLSIIRPPMVYGPGCPGNFNRLVRLVKWLPIFPRIDNKRSMIYIDNLCAFMAHLIEEGLGGVFLPQNKDYVNTTELVQLIAKLLGKRMRFTRVFNPLVGMVGRFVPAVRKLFGSLVYQHCGSGEAYCGADFDEGVRLTVRSLDALVTKTPEATK